jgi:hypothetical protein
MPFNINLQKAAHFTTAKDSSRLLHGGFYMTGKIKLVDGFIETKTGANCQQNSGEDLTWGRSLTACLVCVPMVFVE